jgi:hypothetical protein
MPRRQGEDESRDESTLIRHEPTSIKNEGTQGPIGCCSQRLHLRIANLRSSC